MHHGVTCDVDWIKIEIKDKSSHPPVKRKVMFFHPIKPCHYKVFEDRMQGSVQLGTTQDLYIISQADTNGEKCFVLYRIVNIDPVRFAF